MVSPARDGARSGPHTRRRDPSATAGQGQPRARRYSPGVGRDGSHKSFPEVAPEPAEDKKRMLACAVAANPDPRQRGRTNGMILANAIEIGRLIPDLVRDLTPTEPPPPPFLVQGLVERECVELTSFCLRRTHARASRNQCLAAKLGPTTSQRLRPDQTFFAVAAPDLAALAAALRLRAAGLRSRLDPQPARRRARSHFRHPRPRGWTHRSPGLFRRLCFRLWSGYRSGRLRFWDNRRAGTSCLDFTGDGVSGQFNAKDVRHLRFIHRGLPFRLGGLPHCFGGGGTADQDSRGPPPKKEKQFRPLTPTGRQRHKARRRRVCKESAQSGQEQSSSISFGGRKKSLLLGGSWVA